MHCEELQTRLVESWGGKPSPEIEEHAAQCEECARYLRDRRLVEAGFGALRQEAVPEPSLGFAERLIRQVAGMGRRPSLGEFFELVGRRFVYATLALTFLALLALLLPSAGPVRGVASTDLLIPAQEITQARLDPLSESSLPDVPEETTEGAPAIPKGEK